MLKKWLLFVSAFFIGSAFYFVSADVNMSPAFDGGQSGSYRCDSTGRKDCYFFLSIPFRSPEAYQAYQGDYETIMQDIFGNSAYLMVESCFTQYPGWMQGNVADCRRIIDRNVFAFDSLLPYSWPGSNYIDTGSLGDLNYLSIHIYVNNLYTDTAATVFGRRVYIKSINAPSSVTLGGPSFNITWGVDNSGVGINFLSSGPISCVLNNNAPVNGSATCTATGLGNAQVEIQAYGPGGYGPITVSDTRTINVIDGPTHLECQSSACVSVEGSGSDSCSTNNDCNGGQPTHLECQSSACVSVPGGGSDQCGTNADCTGGPVCGNGIQEAGEECDLGRFGNGSCPNSCSTTCTTNNFCVCQDDARLRQEGTGDWGESSLPATFSPGEPVSLTMLAYNPGNPTNAQWFTNGYRLRDISLITTSNPSNGVPPILGTNHNNATDAVRQSEAYNPQFNFNAPTIPGIYTLKLRMVHNSGWEYRDQNDNSCASSPESDREFGDLWQHTFTIPSPTVVANLVANPNSGDAPLTTVLNATTSGTATGTINYSFWWNCADPTASVAVASSVCGALPAPITGTCASNSAGYKCNAVDNASQTVSHEYLSGTNTAKVIIERGAAAPSQDQETVTAAVPAPSVSNVTVTVSDSNYCSVGVQATVTWNYSSPGSQPQSNQAAYEVQIDDDSNPFSGNPEWEQSGTTGTSAATTPCNSANPVTSPQTNCRMTWGAVYRAWVRVRNGYGGWSPWTQMSTFCNGISCNSANSWATLAHQLPSADFTITPPNSPLGTPVIFDDILPTFDSAATFGSWSWNFGDGDSINDTDRRVPLDLTGVTHTYDVMGSYTARLTVEDELGISCSNSALLSVQKAIPRWREIAPR